MFGAENSVICDSFQGVCLFDVTSKRTSVVVSIVVNDNREIIFILRKI